MVSTHCHRPSLEKVAEVHWPLSTRSVQDRRHVVADEIRHYHHATMASHNC
jgi:hypothetical protein